MTYEIRQYRPGQESAFADTGMDPDLEASFNDGFQEAYQGFEEAIENQPLPEPRPGDIATVQNLTGMLNLGELLGGAAFPTYPADYQGIRVTPNMAVADYVQWYFREWLPTETGGFFMTVVKNEGIGAEAQLVEPIHVGAQVMLADWLDSDGNPVPLPPGVIVVGPAPPATMQVTSDTGQTSVANYSRTEKSDWYCFLLESNLNIFDEVQVTEGEYRINNFDGQFSQWLLLESGDRTRVVAQYVEDHINHRFVPPGFGIGSIGTISADPFIAGSVRFTNDRPNGYGRTDWHINLLPENLTTLAGKPLTPETFVVTPEVVTRSGPVLTVRPTRVDSSISERIWVNVKSGKTRAANDCPGSIWVEAPEIIYQGQTTASTLDALADLLQSQGVAVQRIDSDSGRTVGLEISDASVRAAILATAAPVIESGQTIRYG
jgi:hypothetical protein